MEYLYASLSNTDDMRVVPSKNHDDLSKDQLLNDVTNTGVAAALIGGFALGNLHSDVSEEPMEITIYMLSFIAVHACTCSCLTSCLLYRTFNHQSDEAAVSWARRNKLLLVAPWMKFVMGGGCYIASVIALSFEALQDIPVFRYLCLGIGLMSMSVVLLTFMRVHS